MVSHIIIIIIIIDNRRRESSTSCVCRSAVSGAARRRLLAIDHVGGVLSDPRQSLTSRQLSLMCSSYK